MLRSATCCFVILITVSGFSQLSQGSERELWKIDLNDSIQLQEEYLSSLYNFETGGSGRLVNGRDYFQYYAGSKLKPILFSGRESRGSVTFSSGILRNVILEYDTFLDEVIYTDSTRYADYPYCKIALNKSSLSGFNLVFGSDTMVFEYFKPGDGKTYNLKEGFYELVYEGKSRYLVKHQSSLVETNGRRDYYYKPVAFLMRGDRYIRVRSFRNLLRLLTAESGDLKKYIHRKRIKAGEAGKRQIIDILEFYDNSLYGWEINKQ